MNIKNLTIILLYFFFVFFFINVYSTLNNNKSILENFESIENDNDNENDNENIDITYSKLYDVVFNEDEMFKYEIKLIKKFINNNIKKDIKNIKILDAGTGTGKHYIYLNKDFNTYGIEKSKNMIDRSILKIPVNKIKNGDLKDDNNYDQGMFDIIVCLKDTLYHNKLKDWDDIISNMYYWLKPNGYLIIHVFDKDKLDPTPRNHSQYVYDKNKTKHAITHFKKFVHDGWWEKKSKNIFEYNEIVAFRTKNKNKYKKRYFKHLLNFPDKDVVLSKINGHYFKLEHIDRLNDIDINDHELFYFKKPSKKINIYND